MALFKVVKCPNCYLFSVSGASRTFKCQRCKKTRTFNNLRIFYKSTDPRNASEFLRKLKENNAKSKGEYFEDFGTWKIK